MRVAALSSTSSSASSSTSSSTSSSSTLSSSSSASSPTLALSNSLAALTICVDADVAVDAASATVAGAATSTGDAGGHNDDNNAGGHNDDNNDNVTATDDNSDGGGVGDVDSYRFAYEVGSSTRVSIVEVAPPPTKATWVSSSPSNAAAKTKTTVTPMSSTSQPSMSLPLSAPSSSSSSLSSSSSSLSSVLQPHAAFSRIGGCGAQIAAVREVVELSLLHPQAFRQFGLSPPKGVLLHGPPGTGKTMLVRAIAAQAYARVLVINGAECVGRFVGDSEQKLAAVFAAAARQVRLISLIRFSNFVMVLV
jgi:hypothetical protein